MIVFCQTILLEEGLGAAAFALEHCPRVPLLLMYIERQRLCPVQEHHYLQANQGPREFARTVFHMLYDERPGQERVLITHR